MTRNPDCPGQNRTSGNPTYTCFLGAKEERIDGNDKTIWLFNFLLNTLAAETQWPELLNILSNLIDGKELTEKHIVELE